mmetsp:Transcript_8345/g.26044  ORF Transcript_8345/g.26044 Transcript_8345/m.26044 type:complete len:232 (-) Transcript_8345:490-1185(-)
MGGRTSRLPLRRADFSRPPSSSHAASCRRRSLVATRTWRRARRRGAHRPRGARQHDAATSLTRRWRSRCRSRRPRRQMYLPPAALGRRSRPARRRRGTVRRRGARSLRSTLLLREPATERRDEARRQALRASLRRLAACWRWPVPAARLPERRRRLHAPRSNLRARRRRKVRRKRSWTSARALPPTKEQQRTAHGQSRKRRTARRKPRPRRRRNVTAQLRTATSPRFPRVP